VSPRRRATPRGCYWRGNTLWGRIKFGGKRIAWSLNTADPAEATSRFEARVKTLRDPVGADEARRRLIAGERLTPEQAELAAAALDFLVARGLGATHAAAGK
jgi:hypothetical protein